RRQRRLHDRLDGLGVVAEAGQFGLGVLDLHGALETTLEGEAGERDRGGADPLDAGLERAGDAGAEALELGAEGGQPGLAAEVAHGAAELLGVSKDADDDLLLGHETGPPLGFTSRRRGTCGTR